jgi:sugar phosphate permease
MIPSSTLRAWLVWTVAALFVVFNYLHQVVPNIIADDLSRAFNVSASALGDIAASYFYAYAVLQIPVGFIVDRCGTRWPLVLTIFVAALGTLAFSAVHAADNAQLTRVIMGASSAFSFIGCLKLVQEWFPPSRFSTLAGMTNTAAMLGAACGAPLALLVKSVGWRAAIAWMGGAELLLAVLALLMVRDRPAASNDLAPQPEPQRGNIAQVLINPHVWINAIYATSISLVFVAFGGLWGANYIQKAYGVSVIAAADTGALLFLGGIGGSVFYGWYSDYLGKRKSPMVQAGIGALITMSCMLYLPGLPLSGFKVALFLVGFFSSANIISYAVARDLYPRLAGLSIGFLSTLYYLGSATSQPLVGILLERRNSGGPGAGLAALTAGDFRFAFLPLVFFMLVGLIAAMLLKETLAGKHPPDAVQPVPINRAALN